MNYKFPQRLQDKLGGTCQGQGIGSGRSSRELRDQDLSLREIARMDHVSLASVCCALGSAGAPDQRVKNRTKDLESRQTICADQATVKKGFVERVSKMSEFLP